MSVLTHSAALMVLLRNSFTCYTFRAKLRPLRSPEEKSRGAKVEEGSDQEIRLPLPTQRSGNSLPRKARTRPDKSEMVENCSNWDMTQSSFLQYGQKCHLSP